MFKKPYNIIYMTDAEKARKEQALSTSEKEIAGLVHDVSPTVIRALLNNRNLSEDDVLAIAARKNLPADIFELIAKDKRWVKSYPVRLALARNPKTPLSASLSIARYLRLFDLAEISRSHFLPLVFRHKIEAIIIEKIPTMDLGIKKTLAKIASGEVLLKLIQSGYPEVVKLCLDNPHLIEAHLYKVVNRHNIAPLTIKAIAEHANWSSRSMIKLALIRNEHTSLALSVRFLRDTKIMYLRELYADPSVPVTIKPFIHRELLERGEQPGIIPEEQVFEMDEEDEAMIEKFNEDLDRRGK
jgi:hypothetical protein